MEMSIDGVREGEREREGGSQVSGHNEVAVVDVASRVAKWGRNENEEY